MTTFLSITQRPGNRWRKNKNENQIGCTCIIRSWPFRGFHKIRNEVGQYHSIQIFHYNPSMIIKKNLKLEIKLVDIAIFSHCMNDDIRWYMFRALSEYDRFQNGPVQGVIFTLRADFKVFCFFIMCNYKSMRYAITSWSTNLQNDCSK